MSGLLRRIRRPGAAEETRTDAIAHPEPAHGSAPTAPNGERPAAPVRADGRPLPAGVAPEDLERRSTAGRRGKVRRRARFLRRARELALRDLGGLVYEAHRRDQDGGALVRQKVQHLELIDAELRGLDAELGAPRGETVVREPGVGGTCRRCGELHASEARFCSRCGLDLTAAPAEPAAPGAATVQPEAAPAKPAAAGAATVQPEAAPAEPAAAEASAAEEPVAEPSEQPTTEAPAPARNGRAVKTDPPEPAAAETPAERGA